MSRGRPRPSFLSGKTGREIRRAIADRMGCHCLYCGIPFDSADDATLDHFIAVAVWPRGINKKRNWVLACDPCNQAKGSRLPWPLVWLLLQHADAILSPTYRPDFVPALAA